MRRRNLNRTECPKPLQRWPSALADTRTRARYRNATGNTNPSVHLRRQLSLCTPQRQKGRDPATQVTASVKTQGSASGRAAPCPLWTQTIAPLRGSSCLMTWPAFLDDTNIVKVRRQFNSPRTTLQHPNCRLRSAAFLRPTTGFRGNLTTPGGIIKERGITGDAEDTPSQTTATPDLGPGPELQPTPRPGGLTKILWPFVQRICSSSQGGRHTDSCADLAASVKFRLFLPGSAN